MIDFQDIIYYRRCDSNHQHETPQNINGLSLRPILLTDLDLMLVNQWMRLKIKNHF